MLHIHPWPSFAVMCSWFVARSLEDRFVSVKCESASRRGSCIVFPTCAFIAPAPQFAVAPKTFCPVFGFWLCVVDKPGWLVVALFVLFRLGFT